MSFYIGNRNITGIYVGGTEISAAYVGDVNVFGNTTPIPDYLKFTAKADNSTIGLTAKSSNQTLEYSLNGSDWTSMTTATLIEMNSGDTVYVRGTLTSDNGASDYTQFSINGNVKASGNMNYVWDYEYPTNDLKQYCGGFMFQNCYGLTDISELTLPATHLANNCYNTMFANSGVASTVPALPATSLTMYCYYAMYKGTAISTAPELPAVTLGNSCYREMFANTLITTAPALNATVISNGCYEHMFSGCTSLVTPPSVLPANVLQSYCYYGMFMGCSSLTTAPVLPAPTLQNQCYRYMFQNCVSLDKIKCLATKISASNCTNLWVQNVASSGTFVKSPEMSNWTTGNNGIPTNWVVENGNEFITFTANADNSSLGLEKKSSNQTLKYSTDGLIWSSMTTATTIALSIGDSVYVRGTLASDNTSSDYTQFKMDGDLSVSGNINYVWNYQDPDAQLKDYCGLFLFSDCTGLTDISQLSFPSMNLSDSGYRNMFSGCTSLVTPPSVLPATTLQSYCYYGMFAGCSSLTTAPELQAPTLQSNSYENLFSGCTNLNYIKCLATNISATDCTKNWVDNVASSGTFVKSPEMSSWTIGANGIPTNWVVEDDEDHFITFTAKADNSSVGLSNISTNQTLEYSMDGENWSAMTIFEAPVLNSGDTVYVRGTLESDNTSTDYTQFAINGDIKVSGNINYLWNYTNPNTALKPYCGYKLFMDCTALSDVSELRLPATVVALGCYNTMFANSGVASTVPELPAVTLGNSCYREMFANTLITTPPSVLPARALKSNCYYGMFMGCTSLTTAPVLSGTTMALNSCRRMFMDCSSLTTAPELPATQLYSGCYNEMFNGCTSLVTPPSVLPATVIAGTSTSTSPYANMFYGCTSLTRTPIILSDEFNVKFSHMFEGCTNLNHITCLATQFSYGAIFSWVSGVSASGTFVKNALTPTDPYQGGWATGDNGIPSGWTVEDYVENNT